MISNFDFLTKYWPDMAEIGKTAEMYLYSDSNACIYKLGLLEERIVAEKQAALEVVQRRLESIGIGSFCLELHSNKSKKKDVLEQPRRATEVTKYQTSEQYAAKAEQIAKLRSELDLYVTQLHNVQTCGFTLYELINEYEEYRDAPDIAAFPSESVSAI